MRVTFILLLAVCISGLASATEVPVQDPVLTITGHYRSSDGRASEHMFPVELKLLADGTFTGTIESWIELWLSNGTSHLDYFDTAFGGTWNLTDQHLHIIVLKGDVSPQIAFPEINGLKVTLTKKDS